MGFVRCSASSRELALATEGLVHEHVMSPLPPKRLAWHTLFDARLDSGVLTQGSKCRLLKSGGRRSRPIEIFEL